MNVLRFFSEAVEKEKTVEESGERAPGCRRGTESP